MLGAAGYGMHTKRLHDRATQITKPREPIMLWHHPRPLRRRRVVVVVCLYAPLEVYKALLRVKLLAGRQFHLHGRLEVRLEENILFKVLLR